MHGLLKGVLDCDQVDPQNSAAVVADWNGLSYSRTAGYGLPGVGRHKVVGVPSMQTSRLHAPGHGVSPSAMHVPALLVGGGGVHNSFF